MKICVHEVPRPKWKCLKRNRALGFELSNGLVECRSLSVIFLLPSPPLSERRYCDARRSAVCVCVSAALISAAKVMRCIQCSVVIIATILDSCQLQKYRALHRMYGWNTVYSACLCLRDVQFCHQSFTFIETVQWWISPPSTVAHCLQKDGQNCHNFSVNFCSAYFNMQWKLNIFVLEDGKNFMVVSVIFSSFSWNKWFHRFPSSVY